MAFCAQRVLVLVNLDKSDAAVFSRSVIKRLTELGIQCEVAEFSGDPGEKPSMSGISLVVTLGGDGTVLYAARLASPSAIPVFPVNLGRLGFIAEIGRDDWRGSLDSWVAGALPISARLMLCVEAWRDGKLAATHIALNDAVISAQGIAKVIGLGVRVGGSLLGRYRSDGIIVATPTGSTAYNLAAGGPVLHPEMEAIAINPICPFTLSNRPLVLGADETIEIHIEEGRRTTVMLTIDGQETFSLLPDDRIRIKKASKKALIHRPERFAFFELLRTKLAWSGGSDA